MERDRIVIDTETTGVDGKRDEILQLAICDGDGNELWNKRYKPVEKESWPKAQELNGISPEDVAGCGHLAEDIAEIQAIVDKAAEVVIYNAPFDLKFLRRAGIRVEDDSVVDTMVEFAPYGGRWNEQRGEFKWVALSVATDLTGYEWVGDAHDALADCRATAYVQRWVDRMRGRSAARNA